MQPQQQMLSLEAGLAALELAAGHSYRSEYSGSRLLKSALHQLNSLNLTRFLSSVAHQLRLVGQLDGLISIYRGFRLNRPKAARGRLIPVDFFSLSILWSLLFVCDSRISTDSSSKCGFYAPWI